MKYLSWKIDMESASWETFRHPSPAVDQPGWWGGGGGGGDGCLRKGVGERRKRNQAEGRGGVRLFMRTR